MTPRMYFAFRKHHLEREKRENTRWAVMYSMYYNVHKVADLPEKSPQDFLKPATEQTQAANLEYNVEQQIALARAYTMQVRAAQGMPLDD